MIWLRRRLALLICPELGRNSMSADLQSQVVTLCELMAKASGRSVTTISRLATGSGMTVQRLKSGRRITTDRAYRALLWLDENWDTRAKWPADIPRISTFKKSAA